jgi:hypothetical protein
MVNNISIKLPRVTQQKRTCLHRYNIVIGIIMISTNRKVDACCMSDLGLIIVVEPLNIVWMSVSMCRQVNLCHKISTHQIVAATSIDDGTSTAIFDDEENLEYVMSLKLLRLIHVSTQDPLHDIGVGAILGRLPAPKDMFTIILVR